MSEVKEMLEYMAHERRRIALRVQTVMLKAMQEFMVKRGFVQLTPVITSPFTDPLSPDSSSSVVAIPTLEYCGQRLMLTQSMILHKQLAIAAGYDKVFCFSPNVRLEKPERGRTGRHLFEFMQMDFEIAFASMRDVMKLTEKLVSFVIKEVKKHCADELRAIEAELEVPKRPFKVYTSHEIVERFGKYDDDAASREEKEPFWIICHKRGFYDREDPERPGHYRNFDLIWPLGFGEALSGGEREYEYEKIVSRIKRDGLPKHIDEKIYSTYLKLAKARLLKPSAGAGIGVERFLRFLVRAKHVGDVQLFRRVPGEKVIA